MSDLPSLADEIAVNTDDVAYPVGRLACGQPRTVRQSMPVLALTPAAGGESQGRLPDS